MFAPFGFQSSRQLENGFGRSFRFGDVTVAQNGVVFCLRTEMVSDGFDYGGLERARRQSPTRRIHTAGDQSVRDVIPLPFSTPQRVSGCQDIACLVTHLPFERCLCTCPLPCGCTAAACAGRLQMLLHTVPEGTVRQNPLEAGRTPP